MGIIARQSIKASLVGFVGVGIGAFSRLFLYTKFLSPNEIGILETIIKLGLLLSPFFIIGAPKVITKYYNKELKDEQNASLLFTYIFLLLLVLIPISTLLYLLFKDQIFSMYEAAPELKQYFLLPLLVAILYGGFNFLKGISIVHFRIAVPAMISGVLDRILIVILLVVYGVYHAINIETFMYWNIALFFGVPFVLILFYILFILKPNVVYTSLSKVKKVLKQTFAYNSYLVLGTLSGVIISAIDVNMISGSLGTQLAGVYTIAFFMGMVIDIPRRNLTNAVYPILNAAFINNEPVKIKSLYQKSSLNQFLIGSFIFLLIWLNVDAIFGIIPNGESFKGGKYVVLFIGLSRLFDMLMGVNRQIIELSTYYRINLVINIFMSFSVILLNLVFIKMDSFYFGGINGVAFASLLAVLLSSFVAFFVVYSKEGIIPFNLNHFKILALIGISLILSIFIDFENNYLHIAVNSIVLGSLYLFATYYFNISQDLQGVLFKIRDKLLP